MQSLVPGLIAAALVLVAARPAFPSCGDSPGDAQAVVETRAAADARCGCAQTTNRSQYLRCVAAVARETARAGQLPRRCRGAVLRCAVRSTCGQPGAVACCGTDEKGIGSCRIVRDASHCASRPGLTACVSDRASCCDACSSGACAPAATTTTLPGAECQSDADCDDQNPCSRDRCVKGTCSHECLCVGPGDTFTCCPGPATTCERAPVWFYTCGDPVCGGHSSKGVPPCTAGEAAGATCTPEGAECDPGDFCNRLLVCARSDPTHGGVCPISRRRYKDEIHYLGDADLRRLHDELMRFRLATYRYTAPEAASRTHLGFIMEDVEPSLSIDPGRDMVDLYGYTSMAVAALQTQAHEIEELRRELTRVRHDLRRRDACPRDARAKAEPSEH